MKLDKLDLKILETLQRNGRVTKLDLAEHIGLSASACFERLRRLEKGDYILSYGADINVSKLCRSLTVFMEVTLKTHSNYYFSRFETAILKRSEVIDCYAVGGGIDYIVKLMARDVVHYQDVIDELIESDIGIRNYSSYIATKPIKKSSIIPLGLLMYENSSKQGVRYSEPGNVTSLPIKSVVTSTKYEARGPDVLGARK